MKSFKWTMIALTLGAAMALTGCDDDDGGTDAGPDVDSGPGDMDSGPGDEDAGPGDEDAGPGDTDGGDTDAGPGVDAGMVGGGAATSAEIQAVLDAADGAVTLPITDAVVTYVKSGFGTGVIDGAGFFVQAEQMGPALYVNIDPATLTPAPQVGDVVDFQVDMKNTDPQGSTIEFAEAISMWNVDSSGNPIDFLVQDVTSVDIVGMLDGHIGELVSVTGMTIESEFTEPAGSGFDAAQVTTAGVTTASGSLRFRLPESVRAGADLGFACMADLGPSPLWRFGTTAQLSAWDAADITNLSCPTPGPNDLQITEIGFLFTGLDDDKEFVEITNDSDSFAFELMGCRLTDDGGFGDADAVEVTSSLIIGPGETVVFAGPTAASEITADVEIPTMTLELDADDMLMFGCGCSGTTCTDTVDTVDWATPDFPDEIDEVSVQLDPSATDNDDLTNWCGTPDTETYGMMGRRGTPGAANVPCDTPAGVVINELNANIANSCDLIELRVIADGSMAGFEVFERGRSIFTFPAGFEVVTNDILVLHIDRGDSRCYGGVAAPADETISVNEVPASMESANYDTAFDFWSTDSGLTATDNVFWVQDSTGSIVDALFASDNGTGNAAGDTESAAATAVATTPPQWVEVSPVMGGESAFVDEHFSRNAVLDLNGTGTSATGDTIQRDTNADTDNQLGWAQTTQSWGVLNAGQSTL